MEQDNSSRLRPKRPASPEDHTGRGSSPQRKKRIRSAGGQSTVAELCDRCRAVNWRDMAMVQGVGRWISRKFLREDLLESTCQICCMMGEIIPCTLDGEPLKLEAWNAQAIVCPSKQSKRHFDPFGVLGLSLVNEEQNSGIRAIKADEVDFAWLKQCREHCRGAHASRAPNKTPSFHGFQVIDCATQSIVDAPPGCQYAALSYVWGAPDESVHSDPRNDALPFSQVVRDAMRVTTSFGLKYLWVDKHVCFISPLVGV